jgi:hypothetical protein
LLALAGSPLRPEWSAWLEYYARLPARLELDAHAVQLNPRTLSDRSNYALDLARPLCRVDLMARFCCRFGDPTEPPEQPTLDSVRRFDEVSGDPVPMKLDRVRYFVRARDPLGLAILRATWAVLLLWDAHTELEHSPEREDRMRRVA